MSPLHSTDYGLDPDRVSDPESLPRAARRRIGGRYAIDPFGLDPHLCDLAFPLVSTLVRVQVHGGEHVPSTGGAVIIANRGFGVAEPAALSVGVRRVTGRRLRVAGVPPTPLFGGTVRRFGAVGANPRDVSAILRAGHLVAVPLAPTWLRTGAGMPPLPLMVAMTRGPVIPAAVSPGGPLGLALRPWQVRFGAQVELDEPYPPGDPLGGARLAEAVRDAVAGLLGSS